MAAIQIVDGRTSLWQWDTGVRIKVYGCSEIDQMHFVTPGGIISKELIDDECGVPDAALQTAGLMKMYAYDRTDTGAITRRDFMLMVNARPKPTDYIDPPDEYDNLQALAERVAPLIPGGGGGVTPDQIGAAVEEYLAENPVEGEPGPQGPQGEPGPPGADGSDATVTAENVAAALGYTPADAKTVAELSEEIANLKGEIDGGNVAHEFTVSGGYWDSSGALVGTTGGKALRTSLIAAADVASAQFVRPKIDGQNRYVVLFDENENFIKRITRNVAENVYDVIPSAETAEYAYFAIAWYNSDGVTEDEFLSFFEIKWVTDSEPSGNVDVHDNLLAYKYAMPKWADIHPWQAFEGVTNAEVNEQDFNTWYGRFHALTETHAAVGLEEINMSTEYLAANTDDSIPAAITDLTNGGMYMWHLPAPMADGSGLTVKHKTPKIVLVSGQHGDETSSIWCVWKLLDALCRNDAEYRAITLLRNFCDIYIIPLANPYGIEEFTRVNENGININRDYAVKNWIGNSTETGAPTAANSQYSTRCISWWLGQIAPDGLLDLHASFGSNTSESGMFVQWGGSQIPAIASLIEENIMDVTPYIRKNLAPKFDSFQHWFGHTSEITEYRKKLGMLSNYAIEQGILAATYEVVRRVQWNDVFILSGDDEPSICAMNYHGIVNFIIKFAQRVVETLNSGVEWRTK